MSPEMSAWRRWRSIGLPRCWESLDESCGRLIWPWQPYVTGYEEGPSHHACYHKKLVYMRAFLHAERDFDTDMYDECRHCGWITPPSKVETGVEK